MIDPNHNPVIGYVLLDKNYHVICPHAQSFDPVFHSKQQQVDVHRLGELWLEGTFGVVLI